MENDDTIFAGAIPEAYDRLLVPFLFQPWADLLAARVATLEPRRILETAAGTGVLTAALSQRCPAASITATDLNPAMLMVARQRVTCRKVRFQPADALDLPFPNRSFDVVAGQFGIMFYPDKRRGLAEAARVLRPTGTMIAAVWGSLDDNAASKAIADAVTAALADDPPDFIARTPFGYHVPDVIRADAKAAGFSSVEVERVTLPHPRVTTESAAEGMCLGSPLRAEIEGRGPDAMPRALEAAKAAMARLGDGDGRVAATMTALFISARA